MTQANDLFSVEGKCIAVTGGAGVLCGEIAKALAARGAKVAVLDIMDEAAAALCKEITGAGGTARAVHCNVLEADSVAQALADVLAELGRVDVLINGAGGNKKEAARILEIDRSTLYAKLKLYDLT